MRSVFTSPRLENVEAVANMLTNAGIEVRVTQDRSYKGNRRRQFSFRESGNSEPNPQVWVMLAEDQPRARELLREAGLMDSTRPESYLPQPPNLSKAPKRDSRAQIAARLRLLLPAIIALLTILSLSGTLHR